jgi:phosphoribosylaminoimidazole-succinocarboxamide synthase
MKKAGIILADTKFEFGLDTDGSLVLVDEILTPDSSRYWVGETYQVGKSPESFDKQFVRDYLLSIDWNKQPPAPPLPADIIEKTRQKYEQIADIVESLA